MLAYINHNATESLSHITGLHAASSGATEETCKHTLMCTFGGVAL